MHPRFTLIIVTLYFTCNIFFSLTLITLPNTQQKYTMNQRSSEYQMYIIVYNLKPRNQFFDDQHHISSHWSGHNGD
jgi:hypothetical protein